MPARLQRQTAFLLYALAQFLVLTTAAMFLYPGGAKFLPASEHYLFFHNFFSDLGATRTYAAHDNPGAALLFFVALMTVGVAMIASSSCWKRIDERRERTRKLGGAAQAFLVLSGICFMGIAVTPWNLYMGLHMKFVQVGFSLLLGFVICLTAMQAQNGWPQGYLLANCAYVALLVYYVYLLLDGPTLQTQYGFEFQVVAQKAIVYLSLLNLGLQTYGLRSVPAMAAQEG